MITEEHIEGCVSNGGPFTSTSPGDVRGDGDMKIDWQIYSPIKREVVAHVSTSASVRLDTAVAGGAQRLILDAFNGNVRELASNADFRAAVSTSKALTKGFVLPGQQSKIVLAGSLKTAKRQIADAVGSVVTILTGAGSGSGFLVSDGRLCPDQCPCRGGRKECPRTLVGRPRNPCQGRTRRHEARRRRHQNQSARPYSACSQTWIRGARSARLCHRLSRGQEIRKHRQQWRHFGNRVFDGLRYIQSDVTVSHGSSGGPLLDENGAVIGLTDLGFPNAGPTGEQGPAGLNLFMPIGDVIDFLSLEQH